MRALRLDQSGNRTSTVTGDGTEDRTHNDVNEIETIDGSGTSSQYDDAGNMIRIPVPGSHGEFYHAAYDAWNRLVTLHEDDGSGQAGDLVATFEYDGQHKRIVSAFTDDQGLTTTTHYYYNANWQVLEERITRQTPTGDEQETIQYVWSQRYIDTPICRLRDIGADGTVDQTLYYVTDAQHNVTAMVAENGQVVERYAYDPYGRVIVLNGEGDPDGAEYTPDADGLSDVGNVILFAGYRFDAATGLYQVRHRYHHPTLGRWINRDPKGYVDGMSLYEYVASRPMGATDPMGTGMMMPKVPSSARGGDMGDLSVSTGDGDRMSASDMELKDQADPTGPILEGVDTAAVAGGIYGRTPEQPIDFDWGLVVVVDYSGYLPKLEDAGLLSNPAAVPDFPYVDQKWANLKLGPGRPLTFAGPTEGQKFVAGLLGWCVSGTWTNIREFNAIRRDSGKIVGELSRQVEAHSEVKLNDVTWGLTDAMGVTNSQAFVEIAKGDTWVSLAAADVSKACVTIVAVKAAAPVIAKGGVATGAKVTQVVVASGPAAKRIGTTLYNAFAWRGPEIGEWRNKATGLMQTRIHFHLGKKLGLPGHHLPQEIDRWWKNLKNVWDKLG